MKIFDILIVYSAKLATSADTTKENSFFPFPIGSKNESYNVVYGYFLKVCREQGMEAGFTTSADIIGPGKCSSYWLFQKGKWVKVNETCYSGVIFDKFSPTNEKIKYNRELLFSSINVQPFNDPYLYDMFFDKQKTYKGLKKFSIPTIAIKGNSIKEIKLALTKLKNITKKHKRASDFSKDIVLKDRFGAGGMNVYKFKSDNTNNISALLKKHKNKSFIIQPLIKFDKGFKFNNQNVAADIRLIYFNNKIVQTYIRMAKTGDFRCNEHQGGTLKYISKNLIPMIVTNTADKVSAKLNHHASLYALDFIISNNGNIYLLEGNTGPGLDWNLSLRKNAIEAKKLIRIVVEKLTQMARKTESANDKFTISPIAITELINPYNLAAPSF